MSNVRPALANIMMEVFIDLYCKKFYLMESSKWAKGAVSTVEIE